MCPIWVWYRYMKILNYYPTFLAISEDEYMGPPFYPNDFLTTRLYYNEGKLMQDPDGDLYFYGFITFSGVRHIVVSPLRALDPKCMRRYGY